MTFRKQRRNEQPFLFIYLFFNPLASSFVKYLSFCSNLLFIPGIIFSSPGNQAISELLTFSSRSLEKFQSLHYTEIFLIFVLTYKTICYISEGKIIIFYFLLIPQNQRAFLSGLRLKVNDIIFKSPIGTQVVILSRIETTENVTFLFVFHAL